MFAVLDPPEVRVKSLPVDLGSANPRLAAVLNLPEVRAHIFPLSVKACEALVEKGLLEKQTELIRGIVVGKVPKSLLHRKLTKRIFVQFLSLQRAGLVAFTEAPLRLADSILEPDVMIVRGEEGDFDAEHPTTAEVVVEVAVSSVALDRENASLYAEAGVLEYWIVLGEERQVEVYLQPENGIYRQKRLYSVDETLACASVPELRAVLADWFA